MRRICLLLIVSLFIGLGSTNVYADNHHGKGGPRQEQRHDSHKNNKNGKGKHDNKKPGKDHGKKPGNNHIGRPGNGFGPGNVHPQPVHKAPHRVNHRPTPPPPPRLPHMVSYMTRGCHDVNVWQIDYDTYIVKYRKGNRFYTRRFYPYANRYDNPSLISVNWQPMSPWTLIPPIQLNINL